MFLVKLPNRKRRWRHSTNASHHLCPQVQSGGGAAGDNAGKRGGGGGSNKKGKKGGKGAKKGKNGGGGGKGGAGKKESPTAGLLELRRGPGSPAVLVGRYDDMHHQGYDHDIVGRVVAKGMIG